MNIYETAFEGKVYPHYHTSIDIDTSPIKSRLSRAAFISNTDGLW